MHQTQRRTRLTDVANAAQLLAEATETADEDTAALHTPYGRAVVHLDAEGADVELPSGATVHVRVDG
ncbi:hypothetical protein [Salinibacter ruber]|uniref:hypothetical protein n=1 Tax=Salinibacter ruber TaxID=146919 RepID=UPI0020733C1F|nr:hypothetical protein [Salinibacter ruber]